MDTSTVLSCFEEITRIPRESGHEGPMTEYLCRFAAEHKLKCKTDKTGNVLIVKEASPGRRHIPSIALQAHQDMVCEKVSDFDFDFSKDPIPYEIEDGWMVAKKTTLGADDGIGIAACLALLASDLPTGRIECLFTISEETGMDGAFALEEGFLESRTLINLDSEDEGQLFVGCAGGTETVATFEYENEPLEAGFKPMQLRISGGVGGHSGDDINKERMNALQQLARFLFTQLQYDYQLISFQGGNKHNAICREAEAVIAVPTDEFQDMVADFKAFGDIVKAEFRNTEPDLQFSAHSIRGVKAQPMAEEDTVRFISMLVACPHGVVAMSTDIPGLVETSTNLASVKMEEGKRIRILTSQRSSVKTALHAIAQKVEAALLLGGADVEHTSEYPGWKPNMDSPILAQCVASYRKLFGKDPEVKAIHAGLECGLFLEKFPELDMISFGPTLRGVHAPGEKLELASLDRFVDLLVDVVTNFA
jgi:dipeptidase D